MQSVTPVVINQFRGLMTSIDPKHVPLQFTDDALNVYGDGSFVAHRPVMQIFPGNNVPLGGDIYDVVHGRMALGGIALPDGLFFVYRVGTDAHAGFWPFTGGPPLALGLLRAADTLRQVHLEPADNTGIYASNPTVGAPWKRIVPNATVPPYYSATVAGSNYGPPDATQSYRAIAWNRQTMFHADSTLLTNPDRFTWSGLGAPATFAAADNSQINPRGILGRLRGIFPTGEMIYLLKTDGIWVLSGATSETFRLERVGWEFGAVGRRSFDLFSGLAIGFVGEELPSTLGDGNALRIQNAIALKGLEAVPIADEIRNILGTALGVLGPEVRVKRWDSKRALIMADAVPFSASVEHRLFYRDMLGPGWWPWTFQGAISPNCFEYINGEMVAGCMDGKLRRFVFNVSKDQIAFPAPPGGNASVPAYWTSAWISYPGDPGRMFSIEYVRFHGTAGSVSPRYDFAYDFKPYLGGGTGIAPFSIPPSGVQHVAVSNGFSGYRFKLKVLWDDNDGTFRFSKIELGLRPTDQVES